MVSYIKIEAALRANLPKKHFIFFRRPTGGDLPKKAPSASKNHQTSLKRGAFGAPDCLKICLRLPKKLSLYRYNKKNYTADPLVIDLVVSQLILAQVALI